MHKPESDLENETQHSFLDTITSPNPGKKRPFGCLSGTLNGNQRKQKERNVLRSCRITKKLVKHEGNGDTKFNWCAWNVPQLIGKETGRIWNQTTNWDNSNYSIVESDQTPEKNRGNRKRLALSQIPGKAYQQTLVGKNSQKYFR